MLSLEQIEKSIKLPKKQKQIQKASNHQQRLRLHTVPYLCQDESGRAATQFLDWVATQLPNDKFRIFCSLFRYPLPTTDLTNRIYTDLSRVFEGRNPVFSYQFTDSELKDDWEWYRQEVLKEPLIWREKGWRHVKSHINSVLVVDLPQVQEGEYPEPYFYWLNIEFVIDYSLEEDRWLIFNQDNYIAVIDDTFYRLFEKKKNGLGALVVEKAHGLGYCPVRFFWTDFISEFDLKESPLSSQLSNLDWLLFWMISKRHLDSYASYPIISTIQAECGYKNESTFCEGGFLRHQHTHDYLINPDGSLLRCPVCGDRRFAGAGTVIEKPVPTKDSSIDRAVDIIGIDVDSLKWNVDEENRLIDKIYNSVVGISNEGNKASYTAEQIRAGLEHKTIKLINLKKNFEYAQKFVDDTICRLRYGANFLGSNISWGTDFYILNVDDLYGQYELAKKNGASDAQLDLIYDQIINTEYRNNPQQVQRMLILKQLEPYRHLTNDELIKFKDVLDPDLVRIKLNFSSYIDRFERENMNITDFGAKTTFDKKINTITQELLKYGKNSTEGTSTQ